MCRLLAIPPMFPRKAALDILDYMENANTDGVGSAYLNSKGEFVVEKYPTALYKILKKGKRFLSHLPHPGWTIVHLRLASHGNNTMANTHPFLVGDWAICHNGVWSDYAVAKLILEKTTDIKLNGETDTEVAANVINLLSPKVFAKEISFGGVYLCLNKNGTLHVAKTSGDLSLLELGNGATLISSELDMEKYPTNLEALCGWYHFDKDGKCITGIANESEIYLPGFPIDEEIPPIADPDDDYWKHFVGGTIQYKPRKKRLPNSVVMPPPLGFKGISLVPKRPNVFLKKHVIGGGNPWKSGK